MKKDVYRSQFIKSLKIEEGTNTVNLSDEQLKLLFGLEFEGKSQDGNVPPFYVSLNIHDFILHNAMLVSGDFHNIMPRVIMEKLRLGIIIPYKDLSLLIEDE